MPSHTGWIAYRESIIKNRFTVKSLLFLTYCVIQRDENTQNLVDEGCMYQIFFHIIFFGQSACDTLETETLGLISKLVRDGIGGLFNKSVTVFCTLGSHRTDCKDSSQLDSERL